ncbi:MAG: hypothetical protein GOV15_02315, partial [Candidatus Diapherotrites archaeon]|nr:hypothetical protein [Candidatus Diapherotrites archaeon]
VKLDFYLKEKSIHWSERREQQFENYKIELISPEDLIITKVRIAKTKDRSKDKKESDKKSILKLTKLTSIGRVLQKTPNTQEAFNIMDYFHTQLAPSAN